MSAMAHVLLPHQPMSRGCCLVSLKCVMEEMEMNQRLDYKGLYNCDTLGNSVQGALNSIPRTQI